MSKYERRMWFERLVELRTAYPGLQTAAVMSISDAVAYAEHLLDDPTALESALADDMAVDQPTSRPSA